MALEERTGRRDLTFSTWHRQALARDCSWIDIDCCHYCHYCGEPLAIFELVHSCSPFLLEQVCRQKNASIAWRIGTRLKIPVFKIAYTGSPLESVFVIELGTAHRKAMEPDKLAEFIHRLHDCKFCRQRNGGRFSKN